MQQCPVWILQMAPPICCTFFLAYKPQFYLLALRATCTIIIIFIVSEKCFQNERNSDHAGQ